METFVDPVSPRCRLSFEQLPRGFVKFPPHIVEGIGLEKAWDWGEK